MYLAVGSPGSRLTRVTWMLEELGQPYEIVPAKQHTPEMRRYNPTGKMPALADGDLVVTDSAAICSYLAEKHADRGMGPDPGLAGRAVFDSWMHFAQSELEAPMWNKLKHRWMFPDSVRADVAAGNAYDFANQVAAFAAKLGPAPYALGERFSAVDVILGHIGTWAKAGKFVIESPVISGYFERVLSRPALARARAREAAAA